VTEESGHVVRIERAFAASAEDVFDAWTSAEVMRRWFHCAPDWDTPEAEVDLRVGGNVRVVMRRPDGPRAPASGSDRGRRSGRRSIRVSSLAQERRGWDACRAAKAVEDKCDLVEVAPAPVLARFQ
jgi:hypothetical protein